jgi:hypothetical protein
MQFGQSACMFHISYGLQWRQGPRYIADIVGFCFKYVATICRGFVSALFSLVDLLNLAELLHRIMTIKPNFIYPSTAEVAQMTIP